MPLRFVAVAVLLIALAIVWRRPLAEAVRSAAAATAAFAREAGPIHLIALWVIVVAGVWLRIDFLHEPMRWDESYNIVGYGRRSLGDALAFWDSPNNHAFHTALMHVSWRLFGIGEASLRAPVFICGSLLTPVAYIAAARLYDRRVAIVVAALCAASPQLVEYSTNARGYEVAALFAVGLLAVAPSILRSTNPVYWALFSLIAALGIYTVVVFVYPFAVIVGALGAAALLGATDQDRVRFLLRLAAASLAAVALAAWMFGPILGDVWSYIRHGSYADDGWAIVKQTWELWVRGLPGPFGWVLLAGFAISAVTLGRRRGIDGRPLPIAAFIAALVVFALAAGRVVPLTRTFLPLLPLFLIAAVGGLLALAPVARRLTDRRAEIAISVVAVAIAVALSLHVSDAHLADADSSALPSADRIAELLKPRLTGNDQVVITSAADPILKYAMIRNGLTEYFVYTQLPASVASDGNTYVVVNHDAGQTLQQTLDMTSPDAGLPASGKLIARFDGADVFEFTR
jgi:uncharacterized membrane protein